MSRTLRDLRLDLGLNQGEAAGKMGISQAALSEWENGREPLPAYLRKLATFYKVPIPEVRSLIAAARESLAVVAQ